MMSVNIHVTDLREIFYTSFIRKGVPFIKDSVGYEWRVEGVVKEMEANFEKKL